MRLRRLFAPALCSLACAACQIDLPPAADAGCVPSPDYFVTDVYPTYLVAGQCSTRNCHDATNGHGYLRLTAAPGTAPSPGTAVDAWPAAWRENYLSAKQLVRCDDPPASRLLSVPEGVGNLHPPGPVVSDRQAAKLLIETWVAKGSP